MLFFYFKVHLAAFYHKKLVLLSKKEFLYGKKLQQWMLKNKLINIPIYCFNVLVRFIVQVLLPNNFRGGLFKTIFRKK